MAIFDLGESQGIWFDFPGGGRLQLKAPSVEDYIRITKAATTVKPFLHEQDGKTPRVLNQEILDQDQFTHLLNDTVIVAWEGFFDKNEKEIPCTAEMKTILMRMDNPAFRDFVSEKLKALDEAGKVRQEELEKNS